MIDSRYANYSMHQVQVFTFSVLELRGWFKYWFICPNQNLDRGALKHEHSFRIALDVIFRRATIILVIGLIFLSLPLWKGCIREQGPNASSQISAARAQLANAIGAFRPVEGRLVGGFEYSRYKSLPPGANFSEGSIEAIRELEKSGGRKPFANALADGALLDLMDGDPDKAIQKLEKATAQDPENAWLLTDLSAALIDRFRKESRPLDLLRALSSAETATRLDPYLREAQFNRALALDLLFLTTRARNAWLQYRKNGDQSEWSGEALDRLQNLNARPSSRNWELQRKHLELAAEEGNDSQVLDLVTDFRRLARILVEEELLSDSGGARMEKAEDRADRSLQVSQAIADALLIVSNDYFLVDVVSNIQEAHRKPGIVLELLTQGYSEYKQGRRFYLKGDYRRAAVHLRRARQALESAESPFALRASFYLAWSLHYLSIHDESFELISAIERSALQNKYWALYGECLWMKGLAYFTNGQVSKARESYSKSLAVFNQAGDMENATSVRNLLAELLDYLGNSEEAWRHRYEVLRLSVKLADPQRLYQIYNVAATAAYRFGEPIAALYFQEESVHNARAVENPLAFSTALFWRSRYHKALGMKEEAANDLLEARSVAARVPEGPAKQRLLSDIVLSEVDLLYADRPREAISLLTRALEYESNPKHIDNRVDLLLMRGRAYRSIGEVELAEHDLESGIRLVEDWRTEIPPGNQRVSFIDSSRKIFSEMVLLQFEQRNDSLLALEYVERGRARALLELLRNLPEGQEKAESTVTAPIRSWQLRRMFAQIPPQTILITYFIVDDRLLIWVVDHTGVRTVKSIASGPQIAAALERLSGSIQDDSEAEFEKAAANLYDLLIRPIRLDIPVGSHLVLNCDDFLQRIPFNALLDAKNNRFLVEDFAVSMVPSAATYFSVIERKRAFGRQRELRALIVANPAFDRKKWRYLLPLKEADKEVFRSARYYRSRTVLPGSLATKARFLEEAPKHEIIQFTGHAVVNQKAPLWSALVLASDGVVDSSGVLYSHEIYKLRLPKTRVVILSACGTAEGTLSKSEGVDSLTRAFLAAGSHAVVGSLWDVDDAVAVELTSEFNNYMSTGVDVAQALRFTQRALLRGGSSYRSPLKWAVFQVVGI